MLLMKASWTIRIVALLVALLCCTSVLVDCHGDCHQDDCSAYCACCDISQCAIVQACGIDFNPTFMSFTTLLAVRIPCAAVTDIFRPPKALA
jgi:hypothetical protein